MKTMLYNIINGIRFNIRDFFIRQLAASGMDLFGLKIYQSAIKISHNPVQHSKTKHIQIRHHFLHDHVLKEDIDIIHVNTEDQLADIFTKPLDEKRFCKLRCELNILESSNVL